MQIRQLVFVTSFSLLFFVPNIFGEESIAQANNKNSNVHIWREPSLNLKSFGISIAVDNHPLTLINHNDYVVLNIGNGKHTFSTSFNGVSNVELDIAPGKNYFIRVNTKFFGKNIFTKGFEVVQTDEEVAKKEINSNFYKKVLDFNELFDSRTFIYPNGEKYTGEFGENNLPHGYGKLIYPNNDVFEGEFYNSKPFKGKYILRNDFGYVEGKAEGDISNLYVYGFASLNFQDNSSYVGGFENNKFHGKGRLINKAGDVFEGDYKNGVLHGHVVANFADGSIYDGQVKNGKMHGYGKLTFADKGYIIGNFENNSLVEGRKFSSDGLLISQNQSNSGLNEFAGLVGDISLIALKITSAFFSGYSNSYNNRLYKRQLIETDFQKQFPKSNIGFESTQSNQTDPVGISNTTRQIEARPKFDYDPNNKFSGSVNGRGEFEMKNIYTQEKLKGEIDRFGEGYAKDNNGNKVKIQLECAPVCNK